MKKSIYKIGIGAVLISLLLISSAAALPITTEKQTQQKINLQSIKKQLTILQSTDIVTLSDEQLQEATQIVCTIGNKKVTKELPISTIVSIMNIAEEKRDSFLTIYNKYATEEEVNQAFSDVQPFFESLVTNGLTTKSTAEMNTMFYQIRDMIKKPKTDPFGPQKTWWNGLPTPFWANVDCGIFTANTATLGMCVGTHTILPTIGADIAVAWAGLGTTVSLGLTGICGSAGGVDCGITGGFVGILLATPLLIVGFLLTIGFAVLYIGFGVA